MCRDVDGRIDLQRAELPWSGPMSERKPKTVSPVAVRNTWSGLAAALCVLFLGVGQASSDVTLTIDPNADWAGRMDILDLSGSYQWSCNWGLGELTATFSGTNLTLGPTCVADSNPYWYIDGGQPGATGNKIMGAAMSVETTPGLYSGQTVTFTASVLANTLAGQTVETPEGAVPWTTVAFVRDYGPDYTSWVEATAPLTPGTFSISLATIDDPTRHIQYGFRTVGTCVWATDAGNYGTVDVAPASVPEPATMAILGLGGLAAVIRRRRRA